MANLDDCRMKTFQTLCKDLRERTKKITRKIFVGISSYMIRIRICLLWFWRHYQSAGSLRANCGTDRL